MKHLMYNVHFQSLFWLMVSETDSDYGCSNTSYIKPLFIFSNLKSWYSSRMLLCWKWNDKNISFKYIHYFKLKYFTLLIWYIAALLIWYLCQVKHHVILSLIQFLNLAPYRHEPLYGGEDKSNHGFAISWYQTFFLWTISILTIFQKSINQYSFDLSEKPGSLKCVSKNM